MFIEDRGSKLTTNLLFTLDPGPSTWTIIGPNPDSPPHTVPNPLADSDFLEDLRNLRLYGSGAIRLDSPRRAALEQDLDENARRVAARITAILFSEEARRAVAFRIHQVLLGRARLTIRVADRGLPGDQALALPWELVAPEEATDFPVQSGELDVVREAVIEGLHELPEPVGPLTVAVAIAAPEGAAALAHEQEALRLQTALASLGQRAVFTDLGGLQDLVDAVDEHRATAVHFSGHGLPGKLLFEDELGFPEEVPVEEAMRRLRTIVLKPGRGQDFPRLFFLSSCHGAGGRGDGQGASAVLGSGPSTAATLHRSGFPQVIGYFGTVGDAISGRAEEVFYKAVARGETAIQAAHEARMALIGPVAAETPFQHPYAWAQLAVYHRGQDRPLAEGGERKGRPLPPRIRRRTVTVGGLSVLEQGFIGQRGLQHEVLRRARAGERLLVLQGLGGIGKSALAWRLLSRVFAPDPADRMIIDARTPSSRVRADTIRAQRQVRPNLVVWIDGADALQAGPGSDAPLGSWLREHALWWHEMEEIAEEGTLILATARYAWPELSGRAWVGIPPLSLADAVRMMTFFPEVARLPLKARKDLAEVVDRHPGAIEILEQSVTGQLGDLGLGYDVEDVWKDLVLPVLPSLGEKVRSRFDLVRLWTGLSEEAREQARRIAVAAQPLSAAAVEDLGNARGELVRSGLLLRLREQRPTANGLEWVERWSLPRSLRELLDV